MAKRLSVMFGLLFASALSAQQIPPLPDSTGWGVHVLALARGPDSSIWVGTYQQGIFVLRHRAGAWEHITTSDDTAAHAISFDFVHGFAFGPRGQVWYGTVGNGWGLSTDNGKTWRNWTGRELEKDWVYVTPNGIVTRGDTTYIATADGIKVTGNDGASWVVITDSAGAATTTDSVIGRIQNQYVQMFAGNRRFMVKHPGGVEVSWDGGRGWCWLGVARGRRPPRHHRPECRNAAHTLRSDDYRAADDRGSLDPLRDAIERARREGFDSGPADSATAPVKPRHTWFRRPIDLIDQPHIDQTYRFGSTMGGFFQPHQGVEFNNGNGTPVHAIGSGLVVFAGKAEAGANTVAIRHDRKLNGRFVFSVYYHNTRLLTETGRRVKAGDLIALVGNTGRATNDHLHLEVHVAPTTDTSQIVHPDVRYPPFNTNPELWIAPLPGTGLVAGQVWDSQGKQVPQSRIYGLVKPEPQETPFSFIETYGPRNHSDPVYKEHFAISDVPPGEYVLGVDIEGKRVFRRVRVAAGKLTWVEFRPGQ